MVRSYSNVSNKKVGFYRKNSGDRQFRGQDCVFYLLFLKKEVYGNENI